LFLMLILFAMPCFRCRYSYTCYLPPKLKKTGYLVYLIRMGDRDFQLVSVLGPTAAGKTAFAAQLAYRTGGEIISADSRQVYQGMNIGTGKDYTDYQVNGTLVPYHLVDIVDAGYEYNLYEFKRDFLTAFEEIRGRARLPFLCGGTGLYIESVLRNYRLLDVPVNQALRADLEKMGFEELEGMLRFYGPLHNQTDTITKKRMIRAIEIAMHQSSLPDDPEEGPDLDYLVLGIHLERAVSRRRITDRLNKRLKEGLVEEVESLIARGIPPEKMEYYGLEYRMVTRYIRHELTYDEMVQKLNTAIHQFAKRQMTYFRGMERRGIPIHWIDGMLPMEEKLEQSMRLVREKFRT
jgi:tRNA dimethylallyltransferase